ncbi:MAG: NHL repeat-containing protein [Stagnimonas sp.]|nr:NHL repeat-containing protein [Stagnimonas sp.]
MRALLPLPGLLAALLLSACGGGGGDDSTDYDFSSAFGLIGQASYTDSSANRGGTASGKSLAQPLGGAGSDGTRLYLADYGNSRVLGYSAIPSSPETVASFVLGQPDASTSAPSPAAANRLALPSKAAVGGGQLAVADSGNNRVLIWNSLPASAVAANVVLGQADFSGDDPGLSASQFNNPTSVAIANGKLVVVDQGNNRVLVWNSIPTANNTPADVVIGQSGFTSNDSDDEDSGLNKPTDAWTDGFRLLIADTSNNRVLYYSQVPRSSGAAATYVIGQTDFSRTVAGVSQSSLNAPTGVASDGTRIYIADASNNRVVKLSSFPIANGSSFNAVYGQDSDSYSARAANDTDQDGVAGTTNDNGSVDTAPDQNTLSTPTGVSIANGVLYITDRNNHRVLEFQP